jgi:hypothetical protein
VRAAAFAALGAAALALAGCSLGQGQGRVYSHRLYAADCWGVDPSQPATYDLQPDFFAAVPYRSTLMIRVQRGTAPEEVSDGLMVLVDDVNPIRDAIAKANAAGRPPPVFPVSLPAGIQPPGSPPLPAPDPLIGPPLVHMALYLQYSCHNQNTILYSIGGTITFASLFDADPNEANAAQKFTNATTFDVQIGDIQDVPVGEPATHVPAALQSNLVGDFSFYFERGQPGQPFP